MSGGPLNEGPLPSLQQALAMGPNGNVPQNQMGPSPVPQSPLPPNLPQTGPLPPMSLPPTGSTPMNANMVHMVRHVTPQSNQSGVPAIQGGNVQPTPTGWMPQNAHAYQQMIHHSQPSTSQPNDVQHLVSMSSMPGVSQPQGQMQGVMGPPDPSMQASFMQQQQQHPLAPPHHQQGMMMNNGGIAQPKPKPKRKRPPRNRSQQKRPTMAEMRQKVEDDLYASKIILLKKAVKALVFKNGALCDEVARLNQRIVTVGEERKMIVRRMIQHERLRMRREDNARKRSLKVQEQLALDDLPLAALKAHALKHKDP